ncbi:MAG: thiamine-phosphate kinase [Bacteroidetes bacterium]|nr:thiamine-phosphate kinase [Bacteroidota bacterium]
MFENNVRTEISALGEFGLIKKLTEGIVLKHDSSLLGVGDDCAVIKAGEGQCKVITTDMLVEGVHFDLSYTPLKHLGYKAVVSNLSDIYAMNAQPEQITVSVAMSNRFSVEALEELYEGIDLACEKYNVDLVGGDTSNSKQGLMISITAIGVAQESDLVYRNGAQENDLICVTGDLGAAYMGLQILEREKRIFIENPNVQPDIQQYDFIIGRQLKPECANKELAALRIAGIKPTSLIDISDGLASELFHIAELSGIGVIIYEEKLPIDQQTFDTAIELNLNPPTVAFSGGEDYELLFTIKQDDFEKIKGIKDIHVIGYCTPASEGMYSYTKSGTKLSLEKQGYKAF